MHNQHNLGTNEPKMGYWAILSSSTGSMRLMLHILIDNNDYISNEGKQDAGKAEYSCIICILFARGQSSK